MKKLLPLLITTSALAIAACSSIPTPSEKYAKFSAEQIYTVAEVKLAKRDYRDSIEAYEALDSLYPFSAHIQQAQLDMIYAYFKNYDMPAAAAAAERYIRLYPRSPNVDYAYYMKGVANFYQDRGWFQRYLPTDQAVRDPGTTTQSFQDFNTFLKNFPNSPYAADAKQRLIYLRNMFARYNSEVAEYYLQKQAYVAAINRANEVLKKYSGAPANQQALEILVKSYRALGLTKEANNAEEVLKLNFPEAVKK